MSHRWFQTPSKRPGSCSLIRCDHFNFNTLRYWLISAERTGKHYLMYVRDSADKSSSMLIKQIGLKIMKWVMEDMTLLWLLCLLSSSSSVKTCICAAQWCFNGETFYLLRPSQYGGLQKGQVVRVKARKIEFCPFHDPKMWEWERVVMVP